jgi:hypothetical protein
MLVYIGSKDGPKNYNSYSDVASFSRGVLDSECRTIVCDHYLSSFAYNDIPKLLDLLLKKIRINGELEIIDQDFDMISRQLFMSGTTPEINKMIFSQNPIIKSALSLKLVEDMIPRTGFVVTKKSFNNFEFSLTVQRND